MQIQNKTNDSSTRNIRKCENDNIKSNNNHDSVLIAERMIIRKTEIVIIRIIIVLIMIYKVKKMEKRNLCQETAVKKHLKLKHG